MGPLIAPILDFVWPSRVCQSQGGCLTCTHTCLHAVNLRVTSGATPAFSTNRGVHCISMYTAGPPSHADNLTFVIYPFLQTSIIKSFELSNVNYNINENYWMQLKIAMPWICWIYFNQWHWFCITHQIDIDTSSDFVSCKLCCLIQKQCALTYLY